MLVEWQLVRTSLHTGASHRSASEALQILHGESRISAQQSVGGRAASDGPNEKRVALKVLECNASLAVENSRQLVTVISNNCEASGNCGLWWACTKTRHCNMRQQKAPNETSLSRGRSRTQIQPAPSAFLNRLSPSCKALVKHCETCKTMRPLCTRLAGYRPFTGEELRPSPRCQSATVARRHRSGAKARNQARSLAARKYRHIGQR